VSTSKERKRSFADRYMDHAGYDPGAIAHQLGVKPPAPTPTVAQKPDGWWRKTYEAMTTPIEKFEYLAGLADLSWHDCQDAWFESRQLIQKIAPYLRELESKAPAAYSKTEAVDAEHRVREMSLVDFLGLILTADFEYRPDGHQPGVAVRRGILKEHIERLRSQARPVTSEGDK
jgi:hypothetical protein